MRTWLTVPATILALLLAACGEPDAGVPEPVTPTPVSVSSHPTQSGEPFPDEPLERELAGGETHGYEIELNAGEYLHAVVEQQGVDVEVRVLEPQGEQVLTLDTATPHDGARGAEEVHYVAERSGSHVLLVRPLNPKAGVGRYEIRRMRQRPATPEDRLRAEATRWFFEAQSLTWTGSRNDLERSLKLFRHSRDLWERADEPRRRALAEYWLGQTLMDLQRWREARPWLEKALPDLRAVDEHWFTATALHELARLRTTLGEVDGVVHLYEQALVLRRLAGDRRGEALTLHELGYVHHLLGRFHEALDHYDRAYDLLVQVNDDTEQATTRHNRGQLYARLGRLDEAQMDFEAAIELRRDLGETGRLAITLDALAWLHAERQQTHVALAYLERARRLREEARDRGGLAVTWRSLGYVHQQRGDLSAAHAAYRRSLDLLETLDEPRQLARIRRAMAALELERGRPEDALELFGAALEHFRGARDLHGEMDVLAGMARGYRQLGRLKEARRWSREVLDRLETLQSEPETYTLRSSYLASQQAHCDFHVDLLMQIEDADDALEAHERCLGRALLALLRETGGERFAGAEPAEVERGRELGRRIRALENHRLDLLDGEGLDEEPVTTERIEGLEQEIQRLLAERTRLRARLLAQNPRRASLAEPPVASVESIRGQIAVPGTLVLEYRLGVSRSFLWAVTRDRLESYVLPARDEIESQVRQVHGLLSKGNERASEGRITLLLEDLSSMLLGPASELLAQARRVVIVGDGLLPMVPFAALPWGDGALVETHEVTHAPSMSVRGVLQDRSATAFPAGALAVLADPVVSNDDPRLRGKALQVAARAATPVVRGARLSRLVHSGREAERILHRVPASRRLSAVGFEARREVVTEGRLAGFRILHFATHARVDLERPEMSHLVLSRFGPTGRRIDGLLFAHELFGLDLPADLVVLSACDTALGRQVRGEGLVGLTQAFFHAGASRVLATLWAVEDEATAELMDRFYGFLLGDGLSPAGALREAQRSIKKEPRWEAPYYWAGFVLQGH